MLKHLETRGVSAGKDGLRNACGSGRLDTVKYLVDNGKVKLDHALTIDACSSGNIGLVVYISRKGFEPDQTGIDAACGEGHLEMVKYLHVNVSITPSDQGFLSAYQNGHTDVLRYMLDVIMLGEYVYYGDIIDCACKKGYKDMLKYIAEEKSQEVTEGAASIACIHGNLDIVKYLYERGVKPDYEAINLACEKGHIDLVKYLIEEKNIKPGRDGANGACMNGYTYMVKYLIEEDIEPGIDGANAACMNGHTDIVEYLVEKNIMPDAYCVNAAYRNGHTSLVKYAAMLALLRQLDYRGLFRTGS